MAFCAQCCIRHGGMLNIRTLLSVVDVIFLNSVDFDRNARVCCLKIYVIEMPEAKAKPDEAVV